MAGERQDPQWLRDVGPAYDATEDVLSRPASPVPESAKVVAPDDDDPNLQEDDLPKGGN